MWDRNQPLRPNMDFAEIFATGSNSFRQEDWEILSQFWQSCRILENLCSYDPACKELLLRVPVVLEKDSAAVDAGTLLFLPGYLMRALSSSLINSNSNSSNKIHKSISLHFQVSILRFICILLNITLYSY